MDGKQYRWSPRRGCVWQLVVLRQLSRPAVNFQRLSTFETCWRLSAASFRATSLRRSIKIKCGHASENSQFWLLKSFVCIEFLKSQPNEGLREPLAAARPVLPDGRECGLRKHLCWGSNLDGKQYRWSPRRGCVWQLVALRQVSRPAVNFQRLTTFKTCWRLSAASFLGAPNRFRNR